MEVNQTLVILLLTVISLLVFIILALFYFAFKFFNTQNKYSSATALNQLESNMIQLKSRQKEKQIEYFCTNHDTIEGVGNCSICSDTFCDKCLKNLDNLNFCPEHFRLYNENDWEEIYSVISNSDTPEKGVALYEFHTHKWKESKTPSYIMTHYKINLHEDIIESYVKLYVIKENCEELKTELIAKEEGR